MTIDDKIASLTTIHLGLCAKIEQLLRWGSLILMDLDMTVEYKNRVVSQIDTLAEIVGKEVLISTSSLGAVRLLHDTERENILAALHQTGGNRTQASKHLGLSRRSFLRRAEKHGIPKGKSYSVKEGL